MKHTLKEQLGVLVVLSFLCLGALLLSVTVKADEPRPSPADLANLADIKANQKILEETREAHERFMAAKSWNEAESSELAKNGWCVAWDTLTLEQCSLASAAAPAEKLHNAATVPSKITTWIWKDAPDYKNERLKAYQGMLVARGITDSEQLKLLTAQLIQEAGSLSETTIGDNGCSVGILQYNACVHQNMNGKRFLEEHPEWKSWEYQLEQMANMVQNRMDIYDGNMKQVIVHHNGPAFARRGVDTPAGYYQSVKSRTNLLISL